ncbi:META domain-containing protein [Actinophytocola glycyrrhizae]|uniref:META domain-containing protein n=1 Tax=Actinophytocola glycyrrhizae TaxID=2044873 RepID=A0ABV9RXA3_9PSEU
MRIVAVLMLLVLAGCGGRPAAQEPPLSQQPDPLRGRAFVAMAVTEDGKPKQLAPDTELSVQFTDDGRLMARAGCNTMQGQVDTTGGTLTVDGGLSMTEMGCDAPRHEQDEFVAGVLGADPKWELTDGRLTIRTGTTVFDMAEKDETTRDLTGTTWVLDTQLDGEVASSMPAGAPEVTLVFDGEKVVADTHCNGYTAEYTIAGDTITFTPGMSTLMACAPEIMRGEQAVADALRGEVTYELTADRLTFTHPSGEGIGLHAK